MRSMTIIARISSSLQIHMKKQCAYCDLDLGLGDNFSVVEFVDHLVKKHSDKVPEGDINQYRKLIKRVVDRS